MELVHLAAPFATLRGVASTAREGPLVVSCLDANTVLCVASLRGELATPVGLWLELNKGYGAQMAARDVATLAWLVDLHHVVLSAAHQSAERAEVVRALLTDDEVNFVNDVATLRGAYNRPAPPSTIRVWSFDGTSLRSGDDRLTLRSRERTDVGQVSTFDQD